MSDLERLESEYDAAMARYGSICQLGGTPDEREWAWARTHKALNALVWDETGKHDTIETVPVKKAA